jgi:hypothetical protein
MVLLEPYCAERAVFMTPYNHRGIPDHSRWSHGQRYYAVDRTHTRTRAPLMRRGHVEMY